MFSSKTTRTRFGDTAYELSTVTRMSRRLYRFLMVSFETIQYDQPMELAVTYGDV